MAWHHQKAKPLKQQDSFDTFGGWPHLVDEQQDRSNGNINGGNNRRTRSIGSPPSSSGNSSPTCSPSRQSVSSLGGGKQPRRPPRQSMISSHSPLHMAALFASAAKAAIINGTATNDPNGMIQDESGRRLFMNADEVFKVWEENMRLGADDDTPYQQQHKQSIGQQGTAAEKMRKKLSNSEQQLQLQQRQQQAVRMRKMMKRSVSEFDDTIHQQPAEEEEEFAVDANTSGAVKFSTGSMPTDVLVHQQQHCYPSSTGASTKQQQQRPSVVGGLHGRGGSQTHLTSPNDKSPAARRFSGLFATEAISVDIKRVALDNDYKMLKEIGAGQFGTLNLAEHVQSKKRITLKFFARPQARLVDFVREYEIAYFLSAHLNILDTFEGCFETDDESAYFFVQEQIPNATLRDVLNSHPGGLGENASKAVLTKVFAAVEFMHSNGLLHRNIRAENVLIFDPGKFTRVKLTEFAATRPADSTVRHTELVGSYHAPELCERVPNETYAVSKATDVWALGVLMAYCMKGKFPWQKATIMCKPYWEWDQWLKRKAIQQPKYWDAFSDKAMRLLKHSLNPKPKERWEVREMRKLADKERLAKSKVSPDDEVYYPEEDEQRSGGSNANSVANNNKSVVSASAAFENGGKQAKKSAIGQWINNTLTTMNHISEQVVSARDE